MYVYMYACTYVYMYICMYICIYVPMYVYMYALQVLTVKIRKIFFLNTYDFKEFHYFWYLYENF